MGDLTIGSKDSVTKLSILSVQELRKYFTGLSFKIDQNITEWGIELNLKLSYYADEGEYSTKMKERAIYPAEAVINIEVDVRKWNKTYSLENLITLYKVISDKYDNLIFHPDSNMLNDGDLGSFIFTVDDHMKLGEVIKLAQTNYIKVSEEVLELLPQSQLSELLVTLFEFPEEIKTACKQYLIYFGQFLADIGINANTSIKDEANKVLFTIIPEDGTEALDKIKDALEIYINAPANPNIDSQITASSDIAVLQWSANVSHLRGQVMLAQAAIQMKDATIETLQ